MTVVPPVHRRAHEERTRVIDALWLALRRARKPISAWELAERAGASRSQAKRLIQAARDAGWLSVTYDIEPNDTAPGAVKTALYAVTPAAPSTAPVLRLEDGAMTAVPIPAGRSASGAALADLRRARRWTLAETAAAIGVVDRRTVRRYEAAATLPPAVAARVRQLIEESAA